MTRAPVSDRLVGGVLSGGLGRRMGGPKETLQYQGVPLRSRAWRALAPVADRVFLQGRSEAPPGLTPSPDRRPGAGPLAGLETLLLRAREVGAPGVAVLAVDLPRVTAPVMAHLVERWRRLEAPHLGAVVAGTGADRQPLAGVYGSGLASSLAEWLDTGEDRAVRSWLGSIGHRVVEVPGRDVEAAAGHPEPLLNLNTPDDRRHGEKLAPAAPPLVSVVGWKDTGKTTTAVTLVRALAGLDLHVMALKHGHGFRLDTPGTDSHRLRYEGGARRVLLSGPEGMALMGDWIQGSEPGATGLAARYLTGADVVVAEGWKGVSLPAVAVEHGDPGRALWREDGPDRDRFLARIVPAADEGGPGLEPAFPVTGGTGPLVLGRGAPDLASRLAGHVLERILPDRALDLMGTRGPAPSSSDEGGS